MEKKPKRSIREILIVLIIPIIFFVVGLYALGDYGINWDEPYHFRRGQAFLQFFLTGKKTYEGMPKYPPLKGTADDPTFRNSEELFEEVKKDPSLSDPNFRRSYYQDDAWNGEYHIDQENPAGHPALNGILAATFNKIFYQKLGILGDLESYHLFEIVTASVLIFFVAIFMWKKFGVVESIVSSLAIATYPLFLGESHFNIKDPVEAAFYTFTLLSAYKAITKKSSFWLSAFILSFAAGLSVKFNIVFIVFPIVLWALIYFTQKKGSFTFPKSFYVLALLSPILITSLFVLFFPTLWKNPIWGIEKIVNYYLTVGYSQSQPSSYYLFNFINTYPAIWIFYTTPIATTFFFLVFLLFPKKMTEKKMFGLLLLLTFATILARASLFGALSYGGVRIFMEYVPILSILSGLGAGYLFRTLKKISPYLFFLTILLAYSPTVYKLVKIHPNENVFFNAFAGGLNGATGKKLSFWGNSNGNAYFPTIAWLNENAEENAKLTLPVGSISNIPRFKLRKDIALSADYWSGPVHNGEYVLELTYDYAPMQWYSLKYLNSAIRPVYEVKVDGISIAKLWKNSPEYLLSEFKNQKEIATGISLKPEPGILKLTLPKTEKIMQITLSQPVKGCNALKTGYIDTSTDDVNWTREAEDIAREQLKHARQKQLQPEFNFFFVAREAKFIRIHTEDNNSCILKAGNPKVIVLGDNPPLSRIELNLSGTQIDPI